ncbi:hypothetical protein A9K97_gp449 [Tokyovirus A1]|uniref:hypothetical protein n=1 Tax=Tokyovirus A1 TaxID=1826170 RepID=UPI0007A9669B|nr:hypothetical protein A9K97_gp449 [Tokyovirus A1]BAU79902.1 hypothetical protein [Tokyovirus A1]
MQQDVRELLVRKGVAEKDIEISVAPWKSGALGGEFSCVVQNIGVKISWKEWGEGDKTEFGFPGGFVSLGNKEIALSVFKRSLKNSSGYESLRKTEKKKARKQLFEDVRLLKEKVSFLEEKVLELEYAPGGNKAKQAEEHFESLSREQ